MIHPSVSVASQKYSGNPRKYGELAFQALCKLANAGNVDAKKELEKISAK